MSETLKAIITAQQTRPVVVDECVDLVESEVAGKGLIIRGAYSTVKKITPGFVRSAIDGLLDDWLDQMEPYYKQWRAGQNGAFSALLAEQKADVANDLLKVTDERADELLVAAADLPIPEGQSRPTLGAVVEVVTRLIPEIGDPALARGVAGLVRHADTRASRLRVVASALDGGPRVESAAVDPAEAARWEHPATDERLATALTGLLRYCYQRRSSAVRMI